VQLKHAIARLKRESYLPIAVVVLNKESSYVGWYITKERYNVGIGGAEGG
jgi:hypothetical protein